MDVSYTGAVTCVVPVMETSQVGAARRSALRLAQQAGLGEADAGRAALVATELATNLLKHAGGGALHLQLVPGIGAQGLEIISVDRGPGFCIQQCLADGYSSRGTQGIGLGALLRQSQVFDAYSDSAGSVVMARIYGPEIRDLRVGASYHAMCGQPHSGDAWHLAIEAHNVAALVVDGLGHGREAAEAAGRAVQAFAGSPARDPVGQLQEMHIAMAGTRGGAAAIALFNRVGQSLRFAGIGNVGARVVGPGQTRGLASMPGIVGVQLRRPQSFDQAIVAGQFLVMFTDGIQSRWDLSVYPGIFSRHPAVIAAVLHRDFCRGRDDATVMVIALGEM
jgi:anti-sigma regulatory factor (Ser/Thr protein kinase)